MKWPAAPRLPRNLGGTQAGTGQATPLPHTHGKARGGWALAPGHFRDRAWPCGFRREQVASQGPRHDAQPPLFTGYKEQYPRKWLLRGLLRVSNGQIKKKKKKKKFSVSLIPGTQIPENLSQGTNFFFKEKTYYHIVYNDKKLEMT